ncbi:MAG: ATP-binding protein [[Clostridium] scindens]
MGKRRRALLFAGAVTVLAFVFILFFVLSGQISENLEESSYDYLYGSTEIIRRQIDNGVREDERRIERFADGLAGEDRQSMEGKMASFCDYNDFNHMYIVGKDGIGIDENGNPFETSMLPVQEHVLANGERWISEGYSNEYGYETAMFEVPVLDEELQIGAVYVEVEMQKYYTDELFAFQSGNGRAYLFNRTDGNWVIKGPVSELISLEDDSVYHSLLEAGNSSQVTDDFKQTVETGKTKIFLLEGGNSPVYICIMPCEYNNSWEMMTVISSEKLAEQNGAANTLLWMLRIIYLLGSGLILAALFFYIKEKDKKHMAEMREKLEKKVREKEQRLSEITVREYSFQIIVNLDTMECRQEIYRKEAGDIHEFECGSYMEGFQEFCRKVEKNDRGRVTEHLAPDNLARMSDEETLPSFDYRLAEDSQTYWYECIIFYSVTGDKRYAYIMNKDVTQKVRIQRKLEEANQAKGRFLANMSHDIRTPLNAIIGTAQLAERSLEKPEKLRQYMSTITGAAKHLLSLINDVLDMSKIESGRLVLVEDDFSIEEALERIDEIIRPLCKAKKQIFEVENKGLAHSLVRGDMLRFNQVLINLLNNANKFTPDGGTIRFIIEEVPQKEEGIAAFHLEVRDTGIGIEEENLEKIFGEFEQEIDSTVNRVEGSGLGLAIAKSIVVTMGGEIRVESTPGKGTVFFLDIAFQTVQTAPDRTRKEAKEKTFESENMEDALIGKRFLLVEDNEINREIGKEMLFALGADVEIAVNGQEACQKFEEAGRGHYSAILMDIQMPVMNGYEASSEIRRMKKCKGDEIPIIAMTANVFAEDVEAARKAGMNGYIGKPVLVEELYETLKETCAVLQ